MQSDVPFQDTPEKREFGLVDDLQSLDDSLSFLDNEVSILEKYLDPILGTGNEEEEEKALETIQEGRSALSNRVTNSEQATRKIASRVRNIRARIDF